MRRSAPHPAMRKTPTGGTTGEDEVSDRDSDSGFWGQRRGGKGERLLKMVTITTRMAFTGLGIL